MSNEELGHAIAFGGTAEIYAWESDWVLKLFFERYTLETVEYEQRIGRAICATGLPVPAVGNIVHVGRRAGLLYRRVGGRSMDRDLADHPQRFLTHIRQLAGLHAEMHAHPLQADIPQLHDRLKQKIRRADPLPDNVRGAALRALDEMPTGDRLCHGDFHPGNVLLGQGDPVIIDWIDSSIGNPLADVARTSILTLGFAALQPAMAARLGIRTFHLLYLRRYFQLRPGGRDEYRRWLPIIAAARLDENVPGWEGWLLRRARAGLTA